MPIGDFNVDSGDRVESDGSDPKEPVNVSTPACNKLTPEMLPLVDLEQSDIDRIASTVPGGLGNIQDIYGLAPMQDAILFRHIASTEGASYLKTRTLAFENYDRLARYLIVLQRIIDRHDILRTVFVWEKLAVPVQVVCRRASIPVTELTLQIEGGSVLEQLDNRHHSRYHRIDLKAPPLIRVTVTRDSDGRWLLLSSIHRLIHDERSMLHIDAEIESHLNDTEIECGPATSFRNYIAQIRQGLGEDAHMEFFSNMLVDIDEPVLSFGVMPRPQDQTKLQKSVITPSFEFTHDLRACARSLGFNLASLCHLAWALVVSRTSNATRVVFGTVLRGRTWNDESPNIETDMLTNILPMRLDIDETAVVECACRTHKQLVELQKYRNGSLVLAQLCSRVDQESPLFNSVIDYRYNAPSASNVHANSVHFQLLAERCEPDYPLVLMIHDSDIRMSFEVQASDHIEPSRVGGYVQEALRKMMVALDDSAQMSVCSIDILPAAERAMLVETWTDAVEWNYPSECLHELFERRVSRCPSSIAVVFGNEYITYAELDARANRLAHQLIEVGAGPETLIGLCVSVSSALIVGSLAILKSGGAFVPVDSNLPKQRLLDILADTSLKIMVADDRGSGVLDGAIPDGVTVIDPNAEYCRPDENPVVVNLSSQNLAYVIYTSGSTGTPKGVMIEHRNIVSLLNSAESVFGFNQLDVWCALHSMAFDFSVWEIWGALYHGGRVVLVSNDVVRSPDSLYDLISVHRVTVLNQTPSQFKACSKIFVSKPIPRHLKYVVLAGETLSPQVLRPLYIAHGLSVPRFINIYGPTETTIFATLKEMTEKDSIRSDSLIGKHCRNTKIYLLDTHGQPVPFGAMGEICITGAGVSRGYLNNPELTAERFVSNPFDNSAGTRMYKTGDLGRYSPDGNLVFLGRNDQQVKIRGFRIEVGEVEHCLMSHAAIVNAVVVSPDDASDKRLVAYIVSKTGDDLTRALRQHLELRLPEYMIPSAFVRLEALPLDRNGKLDVKALPSVNESSFVRGTYEPPRTNVEICLAKIWGRLLSRKHIGRHDSFFALGGHSLLAVEVVRAIRAEGFTVTVGDMFKFPTLSELAEIVVDNYEVPHVPPNVLKPDVDRLTPEMLPLIDLTQADIDRIISEVPDGLSNIQDIYDVSPFQNGILIHHLLSPDEDPYLITRIIAFECRGQLDRYVSAVQSVIDRHDILRTSFLWEGISVPAQIVWRRVRLPVTELSFDAVESTVLEHVSRNYNSLECRLHLNKAPLMSFVIARESDGRWILFSLVHHLIIDHESMAAMDDEILTFMEGQRPHLTFPVPFRDYIAQLRGSLSEEEHVRFFTSMLSDIDAPTYPYGFDAVHGDNKSITETIRKFDLQFANRLRAHARTSNVSLATSCHLAWALVVSRTSGRSQTTFGTVLFGRFGASGDVRSRIGIFLNTLPVRLDIDSTPIGDAVELLRVRLAGLLEHEHATLALAQRCSGINHGTPLFSSILNYRHARPTLNIDEIKLPFEVRKFQTRTNYPLALSVDDDNIQISLKVQVSNLVEPSRICDYMREALESLMCTSEDMAKKPINSLDILPKDERTLFLDTWNDSVRSKPDMVCIHHQFERQALQNPLSVALIYENLVYSYSELNLWANRLAHQLIQLGVVPETLVGICVSVSPAMIAALLAILKAGGAYVPLDPAYPRQRLVDITSDASLNVIIADETGSNILGTSIFAERVVVDPNASISQPDVNPIVRNLDSKNLAHVIHTSGSTGRPKGVLTEHRHVTRMLDATESWHSFSQHDVRCLFHSITFDASLFDIWGALRYGGQLVLISRGIARSPEATYRLVRENRVTVLHQTISAFEACSDWFCNDAFPDHLRQIIFGGESLNPRILHPLFCKRTNDSPRFFNKYGPTETTGHTIFKELNERDTLQSHSIIGKRLSDTKTYLLDPEGRLVPFGAIGELCVGGAGVSRGYLNEPQRTKERFIVDPFDDSIDARMYKTGDLARYLPDGDLVFMGRSDEQVKIRGYRIEPGEIVACLLTYPGIEQAVVHAINDALEKSLVAYVIGKDGDEIAHKLREHLVRRLPDYMIPSRFIRLDTFPLTPNGKLDRHALPVPGAESICRRVYQNAITGAEAILAMVCSQVLGIDQVGRGDNFFALGGHSLLVLRLINLAADHGLICTMNDVFQYPVIGDLASRITADSTTQRARVAIPVRIQGMEPPIFFVPSGSGDFTYVYSLSVDVTYNCPIYALPWPPIDEERYPTMKALARHMVSMMRTVQPQGPYWLCGYCSGGILCLAMADVLDELGESVAFVGLISAGFYHRTIPRDYYKRRLVIDNLVFNERIERQDDIAELSQKIDSMSLIEFIEFAKGLELYPSNLPSHVYARELEERLHFMKLAQSHFLRDPSGATVYSFQAAESSSVLHSTNAELEHSDAFSSSNWPKKLSNTLIRVVTIPGDHLTILTNDANRSVLGQAITKALSQ